MGELLVPHARSPLLIFANPFHRFTRHALLIRRSGVTRHFRKRLVAGDCLDLVGTASRFGETSRGGTYVGRERFDPSTRRCHTLRETNCRNPPR